MASRKPREWWTVLYHDGSLLGIYDSKSAARWWANSPGRELVHVREVPAPPKKRSKRDAKK
jgi:hypothetical protein